MSIYANWQKRLAGEKIPTYESDVDVGFYRKRNKDKETRAITWEPVAFWMDGEELAGRIGNRDLTADQCVALWTWVVAYPITEEEYRRVAEQGLPWSDSHTSERTKPETAKQKADRIAMQGGKTVADMREENPNFDRDLERTFAMIDAKKESTPAAKIAAEIDGLVSDAVQYAKIEDDGTAKRAQSLRASLTELAGKADKARAVEKEPHLEAGRKVDAQWMPIVKLAKDTAATIRSAMEAWENEKRRIARLAAEKAERERLEFERQRREAEAKNAPPPPPPVAPPPPNTPPPSEQIRGAVGRAAAVSVWHEVIVDDEAAAYAALKGDAELSALIKKLAQKKTDAGMTVAGTHTEERTRVR